MWGVELGQGEGGKTAAQPQPDAYPNFFANAVCATWVHCRAVLGLTSWAVSKHVALCCALLQLEDVDTVNVCDVWYLAAQYEQRQNRRRHAQRQQERERSGKEEQQEEKQQGAAAKEGLPNVRSPTPAAAPADKTASPEQQGPTPKRPRLAREQQEQQRKPSSTPPASAGGGTARAASRSGTDGSQSPQAGQGPVSGKGSKAEGEAEGAEGVQQQGSDATRSGSAGSEQPGSTHSRAAAAEADTADAPLAAAGGGGVAPAELVLPPYKLGPRPDKLQQLWDDVAKVRERRRQAAASVCWLGCQRKL